MKVYEKIAGLLIAIENCENNGNLYIEKHENSLEECIKLLPHGSGFDSSIEIDYDNTNRKKITFNAPYHCMNENGYYEGWLDIKIVIIPSFDGIDIKAIGRFSDFKNQYGLKAYIEEVFYYALISDI